MLKAYCVNVVVNIKLIYLIEQTRALPYLFTIIKENHYCKKIVH